MLNFDLLFMDSCLIDKIFILIEYLSPILPENGVEHIRNISSDIITTLFEDPRQLI